MKNQTLASNSERQLDSCRSGRPAGSVRLIDCACDAKFLNQAAFSRPGVTRRPAFLFGLVAERSSGGLKNRRRGFDASRPTDSARSSIGQDSGFSSRGERFNSATGC